MESKSYIGNKSGKGNSRSLSNITEDCDGYCEGCHKKAKCIFSRAREVEKYPTHDELDSRLANAESFSSRFRSRGDKYSQNDDYGFSNPVRGYSSGNNGPQYSGVNAGYGADNNPGFHGEYPGGSSGYPLKGQNGIKSNYCGSCGKK